MTTAVYALIGVTLGGATSFGSQWWLDRVRARREDRRDDRLALGAARLMEQDFHRAMRRLRDAAVTHLWWPESSKLLVHVNIEDRRAIAMRISEGWTTIVRHEADFERWNENRASAPNLYVDHAVSAQLQRSADGMEDAITALLDFERSISTKPTRRLSGRNRLRLRRQS